MLYVISGAVAAGKSTISRAVAKRVPRLVAFEEDSRPAHTGEERLDNLDLWIGDALALEQEGTDVVFATQCPLGEVLASPRAIELEGIAPCLLDVNDVARLERWLAEGVHPDWSVCMDHFCWAAFHRIHARDPEFEQRVLLDRDHPASVWSRWTGWTADDPRWSVFVYDSTRSDIDTTADAVAAWIGSIRENGAPLRREDRWWE